MAEKQHTLDVAGLTDVGLKRQRNEDFYNFTVPSPDSPQFRQYGALFVVADGMGGMGGGDAASQTAVKEILTRYYAPETADISPLGSLKAALEAANVAVREKAKEMNMPRIGTTGAGLVLQPDGEALLWNVGDSRVYRIRKNYIELLTRDQSVLQGQIDGGLISEESARQARNVNVTAFIGQPTPLHPVYHRTQTQRDDVFVICSDGLWDLVEPHELLNIVQDAPAESAARVLIALARERGGPDNITVIIVRIGPPPRAARSARFGLGALAVVLVVIALVIVVVLALSGGGNGDESGGAVSDTPEIVPTTEVAVGPPDASGETSTAEALATDEAAVSATGTASQEPTEEVAAAPTETPDSGAVIVVQPSETPTETPIPSDTPTPTVTPTETPTETPIPSDTPIPTDTPTDTPEPTDTPTDTPEPTDTPLPTNTPRPTRTPTIAPTATPTASPSPTPVTPTQTLNPTVITWTPAPTATPEPTLTPNEQMMVLAAEEGVRLTEDTTLYVLYTLSQDTPRVADRIVLPAGTTVIMVGTEDDTLENPDSPGTMLLEVRIISDDTNSGIRRGWLDRDALSAAEPLSPLVRGLERGANVREGDDESFRQIGYLTWGETATILGLSSRASGWLYIELDSGAKGWVAPGAVEVLVDLQDYDLPYLNPPALATPEPTRTPPDTPVPQTVPDQPPAQPDQSSSGGDSGNPSSSSSSNNPSGP